MGNLTTFRPALPHPVVGDRFINENINSVLPTGWVATYEDGGFNECHIVKVGPAAFILFFDDRRGTMALRFSGNPLEIQTRINNGEARRIRLNFHFPSALFIDGIIYLYGYNRSSEHTEMLTGADEDALAAATPTDFGFNIPDFAPFADPMGGYLAAGHSSQAVIYSADDPAGPWTFEGYIHGDDPAYPGQIWQPPYATNQADGQIHGIYGNIYYTYNGIPSKHLNTPKLSHQVMVRIDRAKKRAIGRPVVFMQPLDRAFFLTDTPDGFYQTVANTFFVELPQGLTAFTIGNTQGSLETPGPGSLACWLVSNDNTFRDVGGLYRAAKAVPGERTDLASNILHTFYGGATNDAQGFRATAYGSGLWNFIAFGNLGQFELVIPFTPTFFPATGNLSTIFHIIGEGKGTDFPDQCELFLRMNPFGSLALTFINFNGTTVTWNLGGGAMIGVKRTVTIRNTQTGPASYNWLIDGSESHTTQEGMGQTGIYSLMNDGTDKIAPGNQFFGRVHGFEVNLIP